MDRTPLLCELHAHTTWSDGSLTLTELVDAYGRHGFDVLCVTDHVLPTGAPYLTETAHERYIAAIDREARRAREQYDLFARPRPRARPSTTAAPTTPATRSRWGLEHGSRSTTASSMRCSKRGPAAPRSSQPTPTDVKPTRT